MNRRAKAIWNIVIFISIILIACFTYIVITNFTINNKKVVNFKVSLKNAGKYSLPIHANKGLIDLITNYELDVKSIIKKSKEKDGMQRTESALNNFMEYKKVSNKGRSPYSYIHGFSLGNDKIKSGEYLLTEIPGNIFSNTKYPKCSKQGSVFLKNFIFMNDSKIVNFKDLEFIEQETNVTETYIRENVSETGFTKENYIENLKNNHGGNWLDYYSEEDWGPVNSKTENNLNSTNYFYTKISNNNLEIYINTNEPIDEYQFEISCYECLASDLEESLNELEISLVKQKEPAFNLPENATDPTDLSNVIILEGQDGYNQNKKFRTIVPTAFISNNKTGKKQVTILYKGERNNFSEGGVIDGGKIIKINKDNLLFEKNGKIDTLRMTN